MNLWICIFLINVSLIVQHRIYSIIKTLLDLGCNGRFNQISNIIISNNNKSLCSQWPCFLLSWMDGWMENGYVGGQRDEYMEGSGGRAVIQQLESLRFKSQLLQFTFGKVLGKDTEPQFALSSSSIGVWVWINGVSFFIVVSNSTLFPKPLALSVPHHCDCLIQQDLHCVTCISVL